MLRSAYPGKLRCRKCRRAFPWRKRPVSVAHQQQYLHQQVGIRKSLRTFSGSASCGEFGRRQAASMDHDCVFSAEGGGIMRTRSVSTFSVCLCLALLYLSWGGSFLGIKLTLTGFPPVFQNGLRMCGAGLIMLAILPLTHHGRPNGPGEILHYAVLSFFIMFMNNACQALGQETVPSGVTALLYGAVPLFMVLGDWLVLHGPRPGKGQSAAIGGATLGMAMLTFAGGDEVPCPLPGVSVILLGVLCFVAGSLYAKRFLSTAGMSLYGGMSLTMLFGGIMSLLASWVMGEQFSFSSLTATSLGGMIFLTFFTSVLGYICYYWLLKKHPDHGGCVFCLHRSGHSRGSGSAVRRRISLRCRCCFLRADCGIGDFRTACGKSRSEACCKIETFPPADRSVRILSPVCPAPANSVAAGTAWLAATLPCMTRESNECSVRQLSLVVMRQPPVRTDSALCVRMGGCFQDMPKKACP